MSTDLPRWNPDPAADARAFHRWSTRWLDRFDAADRTDRVRRIRTAYARRKR